MARTDSRSLPDLPNKKGGRSNWVEKAGGLPSYIKRIAKHLHYEKGKDVSTSIAIAVSQCKQICATGRGNFGPVNAKARAEACKAVAEWEAKKARSGKG